MAFIPLNKEEIIQKLKRLVEDFKANRDKYKSLSEADIETKLVEELFIGVLGWSKNDFEKQQNVRRGDKRGRADYAFKIGEKTVFFLEVKRVGVPLDSEADKEVVSYALSRKNVPFAISTNFEQMKIFCVEQDKAYNNVFRVFRTPDEYLTKMQDLLLLSKESFEKNELLRQAEAEERLKKRITIDKMLLEDLMEIRKLIANDIEKRYPNRYNINEQDEIVQRIIDRLIFIRRAEDIGIQPNDLRLEDIKQLSGDKAYPKLKEIFKEYNSGYNSGLFDPNYDNDCDKIIIDGEKIKKLIYLLYESKEGYIYNFDWIDADVLGQVYEQYLGKILSQTKSGKAKLKEGQAHRKEQGIYYTPTYIVDYIVKNTVGELLKDKKVDPTKIKILDPACGSGSFLIKAYDYLANHIINKGDDAGQYRLDEQGHYSVKTEILKNNIYGVDLDQKAVEITKLNLLLKAAEKNRKLPKEVDLHIRHGNSLIDDESVAGLTAFKWAGDFQEGSFDVVIGNPPYGIIFEENQKKYIEDHLPTFRRNNDLYVAFIEKAINLLKDKGFFAFIIPNTFLVGSYFDYLKKYIIDKTKIVKILNLGTNEVFQDPNVFTAILILQKDLRQNEREKNRIHFFEVPESELDSTILEKISTKIEMLQGDFTDNIWKPKNKIIDKLNKNKQKIIEEVCFVKDVGFNYWSEGRGKKRGDSIGSRVLYEGERNNQKDTPYLKGRDIIKYGYAFGNHWLKYDFEKHLNKKVDTFRFSSDFLEKSPKLIYRQTADRIIATVDFDKYYLDKTVHLIVPKENVQVNLLALLGILNSELMLYFYRDLSHEEGRIFAQVKTIYIKQIPLMFDTKIELEISKLVEKQLKNTKLLLSFGNKQTSERAKIEEDIAKTDKEIDELVYKLYNITEEEKKIIEGT